METGSRSGAGADHPASVETFFGPGGQEIDHKDHVLLVL
jgi:hypothetical protein